MRALYVNEKMAKNSGRRDLTQDFVQLYMSLDATSGTRLPSRFPLPLQEDVGSLSLHSKAYQHLMWRVQHASTFYETSSKTLQSITNVVSHRFETMILHGNVYPESEMVHCVFRVDWDPSDFVADQYDEEERENAIARAITLSGTAISPKAFLCHDYLRLNWDSPGKELITLLQKLSSESSALVPVCKFSETCLGFKVAG